MNACRNCGDQFKPHRDSFGFYCSNACQKYKEYTDRVSAWLNGEIKGYTGKALQVKNFVRRYLHETRGTSCESCGWNKRHPCDGSVLTEIDHIDGDAENCNIDNLRILCPNCHSMTSTFRARNKLSKRVRNQ